MKAGGIPYYIDNKGTIWMYFMVPSDPLYGGYYPQIAKGVIELNESHKSSAIREMIEELGVKRSNIKKLEYINEYHNLHIYAVEIQNPCDFDHPHFETGYTKWMTLNMFIANGRNDHKNIVSDVVNEIKQGITQ